MTAPSAPTWRDGSPASNAVIVATTTVGTGRSRPGSPWATRSASASPVTSRRRTPSSASRSASSAVTGRRRSACQMARGGTWLTWRRRRPAPRRRCRLRPLALGLMHHHRRRRLLLGWSRPRRCRLRLVPRPAPLTGVAVARDPSACGRASVPAATAASSQPPSSPARVPQVDSQVSERSERELPPSSRGRRRSQPARLDL